MINFWRKIQDALPLTQQAYALAGLLFIIDQLSKWLVLATIPPRRKMEITPFLDFIQVRNSGVSYGFLSGFGEWGRWGLSAVTLGIIIVCILWLKKARSTLHAYAFGLIIGGGAGNLFDRILHGAVIDFVSLHAFGFYWYVFNVADVALTCGILLFLLAEIKTGNVK